VTLSMTITEFDTGTRALYLKGVAKTLSVQVSSIFIASVSERTASRRLLASTIAVETIATVPSDRATTAAASATFENLNRVFSSSGISVGSVSGKSVLRPDVTATVSEPLPRQPYDAASTITISVICAIAVTSLCVAGCLYKTGVCRCCSGTNRDIDTRRLGSYIRPAPVDANSATLQVASFVEDMQHSSHLRGSNDARQAYLHRV
jgi:hypothetical protein